MYLIAYILFVAAFLAVCWAKASSIDWLRMKKKLKHCSARNGTFLKSFAELKTLCWANDEIIDQLEIENEAQVQENENYRRELDQALKHRDWVLFPDHKPEQLTGLFFTEGSNLYVGYYDSRQDKFKGHTLEIPVDAWIENVVRWQYFPSLA